MVVPDVHLQSLDQVSLMAVAVVVAVETQVRRAILLRLVVQAVRVVVETVEHRLLG